MLHCNGRAKLRGGGIPRHFVKGMRFSATVSVRILGSVFAAVLKFWARTCSARRGVPGWGADGILFLLRHSREGGNPGMSERTDALGPAFAGMRRDRVGRRPVASRRSSLSRSDGEGDRRRRRWWRGRDVASFAPPSALRAAPSPWPSVTGRIYAPNRSRAAVSAPPSACLRRALCRFQPCPDRQMIRCARCERAAVYAGLDRLEVR